MEDPASGSGPETWTSLGILVSAAGLSALVSLAFSYFYFLLLNFSRVKLLQMAEKKGCGDQMARILDRLPPVVNAVVAVEIASKVCFIVGTYLSFRAALGGNHLAALAAALIVTFTWLVLLCRIIPSEAGAQREEQALLRVLPALHGLARLLAPVLFPLNLARRFVQNAVGPSSPAEEAEQFTEEILETLEEGERDGLIREDEAEMIEGIVKLHNGEVAEIMTPRLDMLCVEATTPIEQVIETALSSGHSRIPVYEGHRDRIVGILYVKDLLRYWPKEGTRVPPLRKLLRKPYFIPETKMISHLLREFRENKVHMAIVLDEYGGTAGLVTNEDILEEIVGEIVDEYDQEEAELEILDRGRAMASAKVHIDKLNEELGIDLPESEDFDTLGGLIFARLGKVPAKGEQVRCGNVVLTVMDADDRRIGRVAVQIAEAPAGSRGAGEKGPPSTPSAGAQR